MIEATGGDPTKAEAVRNLLATGWTISSRSRSASAGCSSTWWLAAAYPNQGTAEPQFCPGYHPHVLHLRQGCELANRALERGGAAVRMAGKAT